MAKFCANLSFMFTEVPFLSRYKAAKEAGFQCVESGFPFGIPLEQVTTAKNDANISQVLVNTFTGDVAKGELGFAALPGKEKEFKGSMEVTLQYAKQLGVKKVHVMAGKLSTAATEENDAIYRKNIKYAAEILKSENLLCLIEPINNYAVPNYYLNSYDKAIDVINDINMPNLKLMLDIFHLQHIQGDITHCIQDMMEYVGHVQIAQVPDRHEPDTAGEINYNYVIKSLLENGYNDWIGLEYKPKNGSVAGLKWVSNYGYCLSQ